MEPLAYLYVKKGLPFPVGACVALDKERYSLGRASKDVKPDLAFVHQCISRLHASIDIIEGKAFICDLGSKLGTEVGTERLRPHQPYPLKNYDLIRLAGEMVQLQFVYAYAEQTLDLNLDVSAMQDTATDAFAIDMHKRSCKVFNKPISLSEKEWNLLLLLYERRYQLVSTEDLIKAVWSERSPQANGIPDVSLTEVNSLIYRVRQKLKNAVKIENVRGKGYVLNLKV
ncbi:FHA domain-containing protein [Laceyella sediminis]|uniref:FHA domain-containing protein n=1 Tax=Laceyella sediminis TaxID=573074 RepID=A0ABX5ETX9_9BACL|nr:winged helix-turn-helix domain-containing protein [Laceyella sediminis]PRZ16642.1 FHA domain-containing protein [Laceyella sediminis]